MHFCAWGLVVLREQMDVIGCLTKNQYGSSSTRFPLTVCEDLVLYMYSVM